jgi:hypothetical protein
MIAADALTVRGEIYVDMGRYDEAERDFREAMTVASSSDNIHPDNIEVLKGGLGPMPVG